MGEIHGKLGEIDRRHAGTGARCCSNRGSRRRHGAAINHLDGAHRRKYTNKSHYSLAGQTNFQVRPLYFCAINH
jgi:hypothetical protein